ncbi:hypothetical protein ABZ801_09845 [Actinomadura sp. NPDC047616]|uniref:glycoside hydrolase family 113 n=1 Tax=Actinomadura sp. NPDC047616 TaxID=3155914 RepID=UPI0033FEB39A
MNYKILFTVPSALVAGVVATAVTVGDRPLLDLRDRMLGTDTRNPSRSRQVAASPGAVQPARWKPGMREWGVNVYYVNSPRDDEAHVRAKAQRMMRYLVSLNANAVSINFPFRMAGPASSEVGAIPRRTPTPRRLGIVLREARAAGLRVTVRPLMDETNLVRTETEWRGAVQPASRDGWFASYRTFLSPYLKVAADEQAATFVIGTELNSLQADRRWRGLAAWAQRRFPGELSYDMNWDSFRTGRRSVPFRRIGLDAYPPLGLPDDATVKQLALGWKNWLDGMHDGRPSRILLSEVGIAAQTGAYSAPGDWVNRRRVDQTMQARWYTAVCWVVRKNNMRGLYWWMVDFDTDPANADPERSARLSFAGRPKTEQAIRTCFRGRTPERHPTVTPTRTPRQ